MKGSLFLGLSSKCNMYELLIQGLVAYDSSSKYVVFGGNLKALGYIPFIIARDLLISNSISKSRIPYT